MGKAILMACIIAGMLISCDFNEDIGSVSIGEGFISSETTFAMVDTFTVGMSTVLLDSVRTSGKSILWVGSCRDKDFGTVNTSGHLTFGIPSEFSVESKDIFDSLSLNLSYAPVYYGDTTTLQTIDVYRLKADLKGDEDGYLWNNSYIPYFESPIGSKTFLPFPKSGKKLRIRLSDEIGLRIFEMMKNNRDTVKSEELFRGFFKGIVLRAGEKNGTILQFNGDTSSFVMLHSHRVKLENETYTTSFPLTETSLVFNRVEADRSETPIRDIKTRKEKIQSVMSAHKTYVQSGTGLLTRVDFPSMQRLMEFDRKYVIMKAEMVLYPEPGTYDKVDLPSQLVLYHTDKTNQIVSEIVGEDNSVIAATLKIDKAYHEETYYTFDITNFLKTEIADAHFDPEHGLLIGETSSKLGFSLNRVVFGDHKNSVNRPKVRLYFMFYK
jgi:hypothetical protein